MVVLAALAASFSTSTRTQVNLARNMVGAAEAEAIADAGVVRAAAGLALTVRQGGLRADGTVYAWRFGGGEVRFVIEDEGGKIDLNAAPRTLLGDLLDVVGAGREADLLADAIIAYRRGGFGQDAEGAATFGGAAAERDAAGGAADGPGFALVSELQRVPGMSGQIYRLVAPVLTVYSEQPEPDAAAAPPLVREALARRQNRGQPLQPLPPEDLGAGAPLFGGPLEILAEGTFARRSPLGIFTIHSEGRSRSGAVFVREAVIAGDYGGDSPFTVRAWRQGRRTLFSRPGESDPFL